MTNIDWNLCGAPVCSGAFCALLGVNEKQVPLKQQLFLFCYVVMFVSYGG